MELAIAAAILVYSVIRGWHSAIFCFVLAIFLNSLEWWLRFREPFFFRNQDIIDIYFIIFIVFCLTRHVLTDIKKFLRLSKIEISLIAVVAYSWLSYTWSPGAEIVNQVQPNFLRNGLILSVMYLFMLPAAFRSSLGRDSFERDFIVIGLTLLPMIALTTEWSDRGAIYLFNVLDPEKDQVAATAHPLGISFFASVMICFSACYMRKSINSILVLSVVGGFGFYLLLQTQTRGQLLIVLCCLPMIVIFRNAAMRSRHLLVFGPMLLLPLIVYLSSFTLIATSLIEALDVAEDFSDRFSSAAMDSGIESRLSKIRIVADAWLSSSTSIVFGLGTTASTKFAGDYVHNVTLEVLFEQGIIAFMLFVFVVLGAIVAIAKMLNLSNLSDEDRRLAVFSSVLFFMCLGISMKQGALYNSQNLILMTLCCTILSDYLEKKQQPQSQGELSTMVLVRA